MIKRLLFLLFCGLSAFFCHAQKPKNGTYTYTVAFDEWQGKSMNTTCTVIIKGDSVTVIHNDSGKMTGKKGSILDKGILMKHTPSGKWIIGHSPADKQANEIGGCGNGPAIIDFTRKRWHTC